MAVPRIASVKQLRHHGLPLAQGTLTDGLQRIAVLV